MHVYIECLHLMNVFGEQDDIFCIKKKAFLR